jgi:ribosomal protein L31E
LGSEGLIIGPATLEDPRSIRPYNRIVGDMLREERDISLSGRLNENLTARGRKKPAPKRRMK